MPGALRSALVDRARVATRRPAAGAAPGETKRVGGKTIMVAAPAPAEPGAGPWFECRLNVDGPSREDRAAFKAATGRTIRGPTLLYWRTAEDGTEVELGPATVLVVEANNVEDGQPLEWEVNGRPLVIRKKVVLLGAGYCEVSRVGEASDPDE